MSADDNNYILATCLEHGWINAEQEHSLQAFLQSNPALSAIDLLLEQQLISAEIRDWLIATLSHHQATAGHQPAATHAASPVDVHDLNLPEGFNHPTAFLHHGIQAGASDVHLGPDAPALMRLHGHLTPLHQGGALLSPAATEFLSRAFLTPSQTKQVEEVGSIDFCYEIPDVARFRTSVVRQRRGWEMIFRIINSKVPTMDQLGLPETLKTLTRYHNGLVLVTGPVGSGKSTTLASMIDHINQERHDHIITLEDPIEYVFKSVRCQISQREVHTHTKSFGSALRAALREDPDVVMVGEMRDLETISLAITASETGHLVLGTLHTSTAARTLDRLLDVFPVEQQPQIRTMVSESIRGIVCQQLIPRADGQGRVMAMEVMLNSPAIGSLIRESKTFMLPGIIQTGRKQGMQLMDDSLIGLLDKKLITPEEAYNRCENKKIFAQEMARRQK